jgi:2-(1,2-epoxy-1,2-dihydrophenyl)acetyl-CoA isomerase
MSSALQYSQAGGIGRIHFNRPEALNAVDAATAQAFEQACNGLAADDQVRVVVITAAGRAFIAGGDVKSFETNPNGVVSTLMEPTHRGLLALAKMPAPIISSVGGAAAGAGFSLAMASDLVIASTEARFSFAYLKLGVTSDLGASWTLPRIVGWHKAAEIALLGESIDAAEALRLGMVNRVVEPAQLEAETNAVAQRIAAAPPMAVGNMKRLLRDSYRNDLATQLDAERDSFQACIGTEEFAAAVTAFLARRPR